MKPPGDVVTASGGDCHAMEEEEEDGREQQQVEEVRKGHSPAMEEQQQVEEVRKGHSPTMEDGEESRETHATATKTTCPDGEVEAVMMDGAKDEEREEEGEEEDEAEREQPHHRAQHQKHEGSKKRPPQGDKKVMLMWGYLPGASPQRAPLLSPTPVSLPDHFRGDSWKESCGGGCGFAMALSECGKLITWGSTDDLGQSYVTSGKHEETPESFPLPNGASVVKASAGWSHCISVTDKGEVYAWGWKECVPSPKPLADQTSEKPQDKENAESQNSSSSDQGSPTAQVLKSCGNSTSAQSHFDNKSNDDNTKRRKITSTKNAANKQASENAAASEESLSAPPCLLMIGTGVKVSVVSAGGRHTLALSDSGQVWGWGYGGEGQLGLGTRIRTVSAPHLIPCVESTSRDNVTSRGNTDSDGCLNKVAGNVKAIACGGRHSVVVTDVGELLTFGWGLYGIQIQGIAAGLWHTVCTSTDGVVYVFGGNQFGQLGTGTDQYETLPKLLEAACLEDKNVKIVSCGARHTAVYTDDDKVFSWGWNKYGQLGLGDAVDRSTPTEVPVKGFHPKDVSCGWWHTVALAESG